MINTKSDLYRYIREDSKNYQNVYRLGAKMRRILFSSPISDQLYIWKYIRTLRYCEYHINKNGISTIEYFKKLLCELLINNSNYAGLLPQTIGIKDKEIKILIEF